MSKLFSAASIGPLKLKNRIIIAPMCQYSAENGSATDWHMIHLGHLSLSGAALLTIEATSVEAVGRITPTDLGLWCDDNEAALAKVLTAIRQYSPIPICIQLAHAGRKASCTAPWDGGQQIPEGQGGWATSAPSTVPHVSTDPAPIALDEDGLKRVQDAFVAAAVRAYRLGIDAIEMHAAHGYLIHQFLSPLSNQRTDEYGGSLQNRMRFPLAVFDAIRAAIATSVPVGVRISASDWAEGGWDVTQSIEFCKALEARGCAYIHVSSGGLSEHQKISLGPNYQVPFAEQIRAQVSIPIIAVGLITEIEQAEAIIHEERADFIAMARNMLYNPRWPWHAAAKLGDQVDAPKQYLRCQPHGLSKLFG